MAILIFTQALARFTAAPQFLTNASTLGQALEQAFEMNPQLRAQVLDSRGRLRADLAVCLNRGQPLEHSPLSMALEPDSKVYLMQSSSGD